MCFLHVLPDLCQGTTAVAVGLTFPLSFCINCSISFPKTTKISRSASFAAWAKPQLTGGWEVNTWKKHLAKLTVCFAFDL